MRRTTSNAVGKDLYVESRALNAERRQTLLLLLINRAEGTEPVTGTPLTAAMRDRITTAVVAVKRALADLQMNSPAQNGFQSDHLSRALETLRSVNDLLSSVRLRPEIIIGEDLRSLRYNEVLYFDPAWQAKGLEACGWKLYECDLSLVEEQALFALAELVQVNRVEDLRRCSCGDWFVAVRSDQKSCSSACRQKKHARGDVFNERRRVRYAEKKLRQVQRPKKEAPGGKAAK